MSRCFIECPTAQDVNTRPYLLCQSDKLGLGDAELSSRPPFSWEVLLMHNPSFSPLFFSLLPSCHRYSPGHSWRSGSVHISPSTHLVPRASKEGPETRSATPTAAIPLDELSQTSKLHQRGMYVHGSSRHSWPLTPHLGIAIASFPGLPLQ